MVRLSTISRRFVVLDGLRSVAALVVLYLHIVQQHDMKALPFAGLAVDFFFMLSGFVVAYTYEQRLRSGTMGPAYFAWVRIARIYPLALLGTLAGIGLAILATALKDSITWQQLAEGGLLALLLLPSYVFPQWMTAYPFNMASWSLTFELFVNFLYGAIALRLTTRRLMQLTVCSAVVLVWLAFVNRGINGGDNQNGFAFGFGRVLFPFFAGVLLYRLRLPQRMAPWAGVGMMLGLAALLLAPFHGLALFGLLYVLLLFPAIIAIGAAVEVGPRLGRACGLGGELSYPVYILQDPLLRAGAEMLKHRHFGSVGTCLFGVGEACIVAAVAYMALKLYDRPLQNYLKVRMRAARALQDS